MDTNKPRIGDTPFWAECTEEFLALSRDKRPEAIERRRELLQMIQERSEYEEREMDKHFSQLEPTRGDDCGHDR